MRPTSRCEKAGYGAVVGHADQDRAALGVGERRHLGCQGVGVGDVPFELAAAVFARGDEGVQVVRSHGECPDERGSRPAHICLDRGECVGDGAGEWDCDRLEIEEAIVSENVFGKDNWGLS